MDRVIVVGASAGGVAALERVVSGLPRDFAAAILVVLHLPAGYKSLMSRILMKAGPLPAHDAADGMPIEPGRIYLALPDAHLMVKDSHARIRKGPRENGFRPSVDVLFRSAAYEWGARSIGVVLSGALDDGSSGLWAIKHVGGVAVVQEPQDAAYDSMPVHALRRTQVDHTVPADKMGALLDELVRRPRTSESPDAGPLRDELKAELDIAAGASAFRRGVMNKPATPYTCPNCHGVLFEVQEGTHRRFRCHTGHGFTLDSLLSRSIVSAEDRLWEAVRSVQEAVALLREAADQLQKAGQQSAAQEMSAKAERAERNLDGLRSLSTNEGEMSGETA